MHPLLFLAAAVALVIAALHAVLGELRILNVVLQAPLGFSRESDVILARRTLRYVWHLVSLLLVSLALALSGLACFPLSVAALVVLAVFGGVAIWAAAICFTYTGGKHPAWPLFLTLGALCLWTAAANPGPATISTGFRPAGLGAGLFLATLGLLHAFWTLTGTEGLRFALPEKDGRLAFQPGRVTTGLVALLFSLAGALVLARVTAMGPVDLQSVLTWACWGIAAIFGLRAIGDFHYVGLFKREHETLFARLDTAIYTPLCLVVGASVALAALAPG